jgi:hypothetical protein
MVESAVLLVNSRGIVTAFQDINLYSTWLFFFLGFFNVKGKASEITSVLSMFHSEFY